MIKLIDKQKMIIKYFNEGLSGRQITKRSRSRSLNIVISEINVAMIGFINYFVIPAYYTKICP